MLRKVAMICCWLHLLMDVRSLTFPEIQQSNLKTLFGSLKAGYRTFYNSNIDHGVLSFFGGGDPQDVSVELYSYYVNITCSLKDIEGIFTKEFEYTKQTIIFVNGYYHPGRNLLNKVRNIVKCSKSYNVLILNFACSIQMLYNTAMYNTPVYGYALLRILERLSGNKLPKHQIILAGHSHGAQIAAMAANLFHQKHGWKLPLVIALDPAFPLDLAHQYVTPNIADNVLAIHTNNGELGLKNEVGTVDYYPNGDVPLQPGCKDQTCSHEAAIGMFVEAICSPGSLMAVKCKDWSAFQTNACYAGGIIPIGLKTPRGAKGKYFSLTRSNAPYGLGFSGITLNRLKGW